jgi:hypothetical protein
MSTTERDRVQQLHKEYAAGKEEGRLLVFDPATGTIRAIGRQDPDHNVMKVAPQNIGFSYSRARAFRCRM